MYIKLNINANIPIKARETTFLSLLHWSANDNEKKFTANIKNTINNISPREVYLDKTLLFLST